MSLPVVKQWLSDIFFFLLLNTLFGLILMWNSQCLQSNMNLVCFEVIVERGDPEHGLILPLLPWALKRGYQRERKRKP